MTAIGSSLDDDFWGTGPSAGSDSTISNFNRLLAQQARAITTIKKSEVHVAAPKPPDQSSDDEDMADAAAAAQEAAEPSTARPEVTQDEEPCCHENNVIGMVIRSVRHQHGVGRLSEVSATMHPCPEWTPLMDLDPPDRLTCHPPRKYTPSAAWRHRPAPGLLGAQSCSSVASSSSTDPPSRLLRRFSPPYATAMWRWRPRQLLNSSLITSRQPNQVNM